jgi:tight adherence protein B
MSRRRALAAAVFATLLGVPAVAHASDELTVVSVDTENLPLVSVSFDVPDAMARDLAADDFLVVENGAAITAHVFTAADERLDVVLAIDTSGSMSGDPITQAREAASQFLELLPSGARVAVVGFGDEVVTIRGLDASRPSPSSAVGSLAAEGETSLYDAVLVAAGLMEESDAERRVVVLLSDGGDTVSRATLEEAAAALASSPAELHIVALESTESDAEALEVLADAAGGVVATASDAAGLAAAYREIADRLAARYRIAYVTDSHGPPQLTVVIRHDDLAVRADLTIELPAAPITPYRPAPPTTAFPPTTLYTPGPPPVGTASRLPTLLQGSWAFPVGVVVLLAGALAVLGLALTGGGSGPRRPVSRDGSKRRRVPRVVGALTNRAETAADHLLESVPARGIDRALDRAGIDLRPAEYVVLSASLGVTVVILAYAVVGPLGAAVALALAAVGPRMLLRAMARRRRNAFADQFEGTLQIISGSLRAGYGLMQAVSTVGSESESPTREEFGRVVVENQLGRSVEDSLRAMAERMDNDDLRWVVDAIDIQYEVGGNLAEVLDTVAETIRDRSQIHRQVRALSAEGRMSAVILIGLPFALAGMIAVVSPDYLADLTGTTLGRIMIGVALALIGIGAMWIRRIVRVVF